MSTPTRMAQRLALGGAVLAAAVSAALTLEALHVAAIGEQWVERAMEARRQIADLGGDVRGAGSGIRVYLLTHVDAELDHYYAAIASVTGQLHALGQLTADNPVQRRNLERLEPLISERLDRLAATLQGAEQTAASLQANQELMDEIRVVEDSMDAEEQRLLDLRRAKVNSAAHLAELVSTLGLALSLGLVLLGWGLQRQELKQEMQLTEALQLSQMQLQRVSSELATSNQDLDAFAGRIAHDLKNALSPASITAGVLRRLATQAGDPLGPLLAQLGNKLGRASKHADMMIESLLMFSRAGLPADQFAETRVAAELRAVVEGLGAHIASVEATVQLELEECTVHCPPPLFDIVAVNLIGNALKFLAGRPARWVRVDTRRDDHWVVLTVQDSGPGIPREALHRIFEPFYRARDVSAPGSGIGLATVDRLVRAYGGQVDVRSTLGEGATFEVRFPVELPAAGPAAGAVQMRVA